MNATKPGKEIIQYFNWEDHGNVWHLFCKTCKKGYALGKESTHVGNTLHLLDHAYGHKTKSAGEGE